MSFCTFTCSTGRAAALTMVATAAIAVALGACSPSGSMPDTGAAPVGDSSSAAPGVTALSPAAGPAARASASDPVDAGDGASGTPTLKHVDVCALDPVRAVSQITGKKLTKGVQQTVGGVALGSYGCAYNTDLDDDALEVTVFTTDVDGLWGVLTSDTKRTLTPVDGLGDKAFYDNDSTLYAKKGAYVVQVNGLTDTSQASKLANPILGAL